jgi:hypothetical protein
MAYVQCSLLKGAVDFFMPLHQGGWVGNYGIMMYLCSGIPNGLNCNEPEEINFI